MSTPLDHRQNEKWFHIRRRKRESSSNHPRDVTGRMIDARETASNGVDPNALEITARSGANQRIKIDRFLGRWWLALLPVRRIQQARRACALGRIDQFLGDSPQRRDARVGSDRTEDGLVDLRGL
jgi:hypothetical protein